jgi:hypothetical protein
MSRNILDSVEHDAPDVPALVAKSLFAPGRTDPDALLLLPRINCFESSFEGCLDVHGSDLVTELLKGAILKSEALSYLVHR